MAPWLVAGGVGLVFVVLGMVWVAAHVAGDSSSVPPFEDLAVAVKNKGVQGVIGHNGSSTVFYAALIGQGILAVGLTTAACVLGMARRRPNDGLRAMNSPASVRDMQQTAMAQRALGLRPSLVGKDPKSLVPREIGAALGGVGGRTVYKSPEDVELVICGPRSNKTSARVVPEILGAPGAVIATSNKSDVWALTAELRAKVGPVYLFDPARITFQPQQWWLDLLASVTDYESSARMAAYFMSEVGGGSGRTERADPFFTPASATLLEQLLLASASAGLTLRDVVSWVATRSDEPAMHLERAGYLEQAVALRATTELPWETRGGIYQGVATALSCLQSETVLRWVTPPNTWKKPPAEPTSIPQLDLWNLITDPGAAQHPTLYLLCREGAGSARPIVAAIVGELIDIAIRAASARGGRLDPPLTVPLDEAANIVRGLDQLPSWYSFLGSLGVMVTTILQSREQGRAVWGKDGFDALWSAATIKTIGAGVADPDFCEDLSRLIGDHKVEETSTSHSSGGASVSRSLRTERILSAADIAALARTNAVLFTSGRRPAMLTLRPWYAEKDGEREEISAASKNATAQIQQAAVEHLGPDNPVAVALQAERLRAGGPP
ncbi:TraM recognition domain-containing protein [Lentzea sp. NPDC092896]|uniref:TraM recognition domain-containing protein n=1 Tax=Lentzea sp. NPDC092896 TaxID=3364127 RepID=UPI003801C4FB